MMNAEWKINPPHFIHHSAFIIHHSSFLMILLRLAISNFRHRKVRSALTTAAIALSVSLVVAVTSGYKSMEQAALRYLNRYMGASDAFVLPADSMDSVPEILIAELKKDPAIREASGRLISDRRMERALGTTQRTVDPSHVAAGGLDADQLNVQLIGLRPPDPSTESLVVVDGTWFTSATGRVAVVDQAAAEKLALKVGDSVNLPGIHPMDLKVVAIVHKPTFFADQQATMYAPLETLQEFTSQDNPPAVSMISLNLFGTADHNAFKDRWNQKLADEFPKIRLHMRRDNATALESKLHSVRVLSYLGGLVAMLTATFITFSALSMGVTERQRTLGMLRAIGSTQTQVFRLVAIEGFVLAIAGIVLGIPFGMLALQILHYFFRDMLWSGITYSLGGIAFAAGVALLSAAAASLMPAWWASRLTPLEALNSFGNMPATPKLPWPTALTGMLLILIDPALFFGPIEEILNLLGAKDPFETARNVRYFGHFIAGVPGLMLGFFLLSPMLVWIIERAATPILSAIFGLPGSLLRQQLGTGIWRAAGTASALMVGLATLIVMQAQGHTLIGGWKLPDKFPDIFIWSPDPISWHDQEALAAVPGIEPGTLMPVVVTTPAGDSKLALALAAATSGQNIGVMFFAVDPKQALKMIELEFRDSDGIPYPPDQQPIVETRAAEEMKKGRRIIVTDEFRQAKHLKIGDTIQLQTTLNGWQTYTICAIVWSPGADVVISMFDLGRMLDQQTAGSVFGSLDDAKKDFGAGGSHLFAADLEPGLDKASLLKEVQKSLGDRGLSAGDVRQIKYNIEQTFYRLLALISMVAISAMAVASLGVANTVMASVRSRRWQFGVLRSIGVSRTELLRLVLAEAIMLGAAGVALGISAGLEMAVDARKLSGTVLGYSPPLVIPWMPIFLGSLAVMAVAIAASLWPAIDVARTQPLALLQAGRAST
jgi:putative ABC transport system permease protein